MNRSTLTFLLLGTPLLTASAPRDADPTLSVQSASWPAATSPAPRAAEWDAAEALTATRVAGERAARCRVDRVREWLRIRCKDLPTAAIGALGGDAKGLRYEIQPAGDNRVPGDGQVILPVRRGDRRALLWWTFGEGYDGPLTVVPAITIQQSWLPSRQAPVLTLVDALHEPVPTARNGR